MASDPFDTTALMRNRARARRAALGDGQADLFLHRLAVTEAQERLSAVNRRFTRTAIITPWPEIWHSSFPDADYPAEAALLDLSGGPYDLVIHALSLHWSNDPVGQMIQCRLALRPDGLFLGVMLAGQTLNELRRALAEAESRLTGGLSPRVAPMAELRDLGELLMRAGLALPVADNVVLPVTYASLPDLLRDLRAMGENSALSGRPRHFTRRALFTEAARIYAEHFPAPEGRIMATFEMIWLTGWAPDESQQKPLRPGSARARLADALKTIEFPANDPVGKPPVPGDKTS